MGRSNPGGQNAAEEIDSGMSHLPLRILALFLVGFVSSPADDLQWRWEPQDSGVKTSIRGLCAVNEKVCWFGSGGGIVGRTIDGGKTWKRCVIEGAEKLEIRDLEAIDADRCVAMTVGEGTASRIYQTTNGGTTWKLVHQNKAPKGFYNGMDFWDEKNGILAGDPVEGKLMILRTSDGGATWKRMVNTPGMKEGEHAFAASGTHLTVAKGGHVWVGSGGKVARIFYSGDFGKTWSTQTTPMIFGEPSTGIFSINFQDARKGIAVGGDYEKEGEGTRNAMSTSDGGKTWSLLNEENGTSVFPFRSCVRFDSGSRTHITTGPEGSNWSRDGGVTWTAFGGEGFHTLGIGGSLKAVWAAGSEGRIGKLK
jgi:photosystem II stability/assembly factor-like uncharacterized protein